jgi:AcrR family transcriptional regulator
MLMLPTDMTDMDMPRRRTRNITEKRVRIIAAAQILFTRKGYSQTSIKEIADHAEVAAGLVIKHFESKLKLFEVALIEAFSTSPFNPSGKAGFGVRLAEAILNRETEIASPAMIILSIEDEEVRRVTMNVVRDYGIKPTERWLGPPMAAERAIYINLLGLTLSLLDRLFGSKLEGDLTFPVNMLIESIQRAVDMPEHNDSAPDGLNGD